MLHYLDNAGAALISDATFSAMESHLLLERRVGAYRAAQDARTQADEFYARVARLVNAGSPDEIAFVDSASRAWNMALYGAKLRAGDRIVTLSSEFGTNLVTLFHLAEQLGVVIQVIECDVSGSFDLDEVAAALSSGARMIAISHAAAHCSIVNPVHEIGKLAQQHEAIYLLDGCQAIGQIAVDVSSIGCDAYTATGRKWLRGPRGTGFLYVNPRSTLTALQVDLAAADLVMDETFHVLGIEVRDDARQFELWERSVASMLGLSVAIGEYLEAAPSNVAATIKTYANTLRARVSENAALALMGGLESESGVVGFYLNDPSQEDYARGLFEERGIRVSFMSDWDCPLHFPRNGAKTIFRLSPHYYTPASTVSKASDLLAQL